MKAKIAVVVPVYGAESFIKRGMDSLLNQSFINKYKTYHSSPKTNHSDKINNMISF